MSAAIRKIILGDDIYDKCLAGNKVSNYQLKQRLENLKKNPDCPLKNISELISLCSLKEATTVVSHSVEENCGTGFDELYEHESEEVKDIMHDYFSKVLG